MLPIVVIVVVVMTMMTMMLPPFLVVKGRGSACVSSWRRVLGGGNQRSFDAHDQCNLQEDTEATDRIQKAT
jgi:hypothetical protein